jgi:iron complex transport system ATP-binding protein
MHQGRAHALGRPAEVITRPLVRQIFGVDLCRDEASVGGLPVVLPQNYTRSRMERGAA